MSTCVYHHVSHLMILQVLSVSPHMAHSKFLECSCCRFNDSTPVCRRAISVCLPPGPGKISVFRNACKSKSMWKRPILDAAEEQREMGMECTNLVSVLGAKPRTLVSMMNRDGAPNMLNMASLPSYCLAVSRWLTLAFSS